jgi:hypothetical protein
MMNTKKNLAVNQQFLCHKPLENSINEISFPKKNQTDHTVVRIADVSSFPFSFRPVPGNGQTPDLLRKRVD